MKKTLTLLLVLLFVFTAACGNAGMNDPDFFNSAPVSEPPEQISAFNWGGGTTVRFSPEDSAAILALLEETRWTDTLPECTGEDVHLVLPDSELEYHSDCGTFIDTKTARSLSLTDAERDQVNDIMALYITLGEVSPFYSANTWGVTFAAENVTPTGMTLVCTQSGGDATGSLETGSYYVIERMMPDNCWVPVELVIEGELVWTAEAWIISRDGETSWEVNWEWLYGTLPGGVYRLGKQITDFRSSGNYDRTMVYAEFGILENE